MEYKIISNNIHDSDFYTFETTWIGKEFFSLEERLLWIPILNLDVQNDYVIKTIGINSNRIFVEKSYFLFKGVSKLEKSFAIHSKDKKGFIVKNLEEEITIDNSNNKELFKLGGMGIFHNYTYDGVFKIWCDESFFVLPENFEYRTEFKSMNEYNPFHEKWLTNFCENI